MDKHQAVLWWILVKDKPTVIEAKEKLDLLNQLGSSANAFIMNQLYSPEGKKLY